MEHEAYRQMALVEQKHWWFVARRQILNDQIARFTQPKTAKILEVGCGTGGNLPMLQNFGEVSCLESNTEALRIAQKAVGSTNLRIYAGELPNNLPGDIGTFDLVCLFDVLEHIDEDLKTISVLKNLISKNGRLMITVPAYQYLYGAHDRILHHKRRYSKSRMEYLIRSSGLVIEKSSYFNCLLFPLIFIARIVERLSKKKEAMGMNLPFPALNRLFTIIFSSEKFLLRRFNLPFGSSIIVTAKQEPA